MNSFFGLCYIWTLVGIATCFPDGTSDTGGELSPIITKLNGLSQSIIRRAMENIMTTDEDRQALQEFINEELNGGLDEPDSYITCLECRVRSYYYKSFFNSHPATRVYFVAS